MEQNRKVLIEDIIVAMYLVLHNSGYSLVSLKSKDLLEYAPKLEVFLEKNDLLLQDLFIKTPVEETYDQYKNFLIKELYGNKLGYFNEDYNGIILDVPNFYIHKHLERVKDYRSIIQDGCYLISGEIGFIDDDFIADIATSKSKRIGAKKL